MARVTGALGLVLGATGCGGVTSLAYPAPPRTVPAPASTTLPPPADYTGVAEASVSGGTTTTLPAIGPGGATIDGTVLGPSGPVAGATVQAARIVDGAAASVDATTAADGSFTISHILGGIYRVRAWQEPALAVTSPQIFFIGSTDTHAVTMSLTSYAGVTLNTSMAPNPVEVGGPANLVVRVTQQTVGADGVVRPVPVAGQSVDITSAGGWSVTGLDPSTTDPTGSVMFLLDCTEAGASQLMASVNGAAPTAIVTSTCVAAPGGGVPDGGVPGGSTTTSSTIPGSSGAPTSSTSVP